MLFQFQRIQHVYHKRIQHVYHKQVYNNDMKTICLAFNCITLGTFEIKYNHTSNLQLNWFSCYTHIFKICKMVCKVFKNEPCKTWKTALKKFELIWSASADRLSRPHHFKDCLLHILLGLCITWQIYLQNFSAILNVLLCRNSHSATTTKNTHKTQNRSTTKFLHRCC